MWSFANTIRCPWVFVHRVNAVNMSRSPTLPMTCLKNDYRWGTRSLHEALRQRPLFQIAACPAKWGRSFNFDEKWCDFPIKLGVISPGHWIKKVAWFCGLLLLNLWTQTKTAIYMGRQKVLWNLVNLVFPSFLDLVSPQTWRLTGVVRFMTCNRHNLIHRDFRMCKNYSNKCIY